MKNHWAEALNNHMPQNITIEPYTTIFSLLMLREARYISSKASKLANKLYIEPQTFWIHDEIWTWCKHYACNNKETFLQRFSKNSPEFLENLNPLDVKFWWQLLTFITVETFLLVQYLLVIPNASELLENIEELFLDTTCLAC